VYTLAPARPPAVTPRGRAVAAERPTQVIPAVARPGRRDRPPIVVALIPAWNEAKFIVGTIDGLRQQTRPPDMIVVVANNCTDDTAEVARAAGAEVIEMPRNPGRKAGALNYGIETLLPSLADQDRIFVQDADTVCVPRWLELACKLMDRDPRAVVSGRYACKAQYGLIGLLQRNEFARECRTIDRRGDQTYILVGTSTLLPVGMLREVIAGRAAGRLPAGYVYVPESLTEDFELTLAAKTLGWRTLSPHGCDAITDVMPTWRALWHQRIRWMQGGVEDLRRYGWTKVTSSFHARRAWILFGLASMWLFYATLIATFALSGTVVTSLPWALLTAVFIIDRVAGVRAQGPASMLFAALLIPEVIYNMFAQAVYVTALCKAFRGGPSAWHETVAYMNAHHLGATTTVRPDATGAVVPYAGPVTAPAPGVAPPAQQAQTAVPFGPTARPGQVRPTSTPKRAPTKPAPTKPAPKPTPTAPDPTAPAPDPTAPAPDPTAPAPDPTPPAPTPAAPAPDPTAPAPDPTAPAPATGIPTPPATSTPAI
jgi:cellulose synthase/poly-beta-1,6-N-acetylglucosamine synthase-like glycosyltransferase